MTDSSIRFLIVDDMAENIMALDTLLQRDGLIVDHAHSAAEALELMLLHDYALAFLDVQMPGTDGYELAELMRSTERTRPIPIIFVTAADRDETRRFRGYEAGAVDYIVKPIDPVVLKSKADVFFRIGQQAKDLQRQRDEMRRIAMDRDRAADLLRAHTDNSPLAFVTLHEDLTVADWSQGAERMFGWRANGLMGRPATESGWLDAAQAETLRDWLAADNSTARHSGEMPLNHAARGPIPCEVYGSILGGGGGRTLSLQILDIGDRKQAEEVRSLLIRELNHRIKNTLANVQAIARQGLRRAQGLEDFRRGFSGRLQALSRAHSILSDSTWSSAPLDQLIDDQIRAGTLDGERLHRDGPAVELAPETMLRMALALHELGTNAGKYGALSVPGGAVHLSWVLAGQGITLVWRETGGPPVAPPQGHGFGSDLIAAVAGGEDGSVSVDWRPDGVEWTIRLADGVTAITPVPPAAEITAAAAPAAPQTGLDGQTILVVEDEPLVALDIQTELQDAGAKEVTLARSVEAALAALDTDRFDLALLDGNLKGEPVDPVAVLLRKEGIPFCFVSGYGREHLPADFTDTPLIQKPFRPDVLRRTLADLMRSASRCAAE